MPSSFVRVFTIGCLLLVTGCASVPLGTLWQMRNFGIEDVLAIKPGELATRVSLSQDYVPDLEEFELTVRLANDDQQWEEGFPLRLVDRQSRTVSGGWFSADRDETVYLLALENEALNAFRRHQQVLLEHEPTQAYASVSLRFVEFPDDYEPGVINIELKLSEQDGFFPLIHNGTLQLKRAQ